MLRKGALFVWAITAALALPPVASSSETATSGPQAASPGRSPSYLLSDTPFGSGSVGLKFRGYPSMHGAPADVFRFDVPVGGAHESFLDLTGGPASHRAGWQISGRVGPLRWLTPLDGEGDTTLRLGGRVPGQPRMPGSGMFNIGIHYNF